MRANARDAYKILMIGALTTPYVSMKPHNAPIAGAINVNGLTNWK